jgi:hypothetical protein
MTDTPKSERCKVCPHATDQHDEDGFCTVEDGVLGFCKCTAGSMKGTEAEDPPEGTVDDS